MNVSDECYLVEVWGSWIDGYLRREIKRNWKDSVTLPGEFLKINSEECVFLWYPIDRSVEAESRHPSIKMCFHVSAADICWVSGCRESANPIPQVKLHYQLEEYVLIKHVLHVIIIVQERKIQCH